MIASRKYVNRARSINHEHGCIAFGEYVRHQIAHEYGIDLMEKEKGQITKLLADKKASIKDKT